MFIFKKGFWWQKVHLYRNTLHTPLQPVWRPCLSIVTLSRVSKISNYLPEVKKQVPSTNPRTGPFPINLHSVDDRYVMRKGPLVPIPDLQSHINLVTHSPNNNCQGGRESEEEEGDVTGRLLYM